ncbi:hypothetical protein Vadar_000471 [Vaccinium darrowii]|uniref:Uncharacterized protein n=1 Tax=Vaccinium darrowii TaxID=229202 RepID=A0ACB7XVJ9_9ERIC|nr:hypothetical protein Vadar_000471 [Vaccinium darrowii]
MSESGCPDCLVGKAETMEAPAINEVRQRKKKSEERKNRFEKEKELSPSEREKKNLSDDEGEKEIPGAEEEKGITPPDIERGKDKPPNDDICPICFGNYDIACQTNCGHWPVLRSMLQPCNCPLCTQSIKKLTPQASLIHSTDNEVVEALKKVQGYNRLFEASIRGFILRQRQLSVFSWGIRHKILWVLRMMYIGLWDHDNFIPNYLLAKATAMLLALTYRYSGMKFLPVEDYVMTQLFFQTFTVLPILLLAALSVYRRFVAAGRLTGPTFDRPTLLAFAYDSLGFNFPGGSFWVGIFFQVFMLGPVFVLYIISIYRGYHLPPHPRGMLANLFPGP